MDSKREALEKAFKKYGNHSLYCDVRHDLPCTCGFEMAYNELFPKPPELSCATACNLLAELQVKLAEMLRRIPEELRDSDYAILFKKCSKGHGRLIATNWWDNGCLQCELDIVKLQLEAKQLELETEIEALKFKGPPPSPPAAAVCDHQWQMIGESCGTGGRSRTLQCSKCFKTWTSWETPVSPGSVLTAMHVPAPEPAGGVAPNLCACPSPDFDLLRLPGCAALSVCKKCGLPTHIRGEGGSGGASSAPTPGHDEEGQ